MGGGLHRLPIKLTELWPLFAAVNQSLLPNLKVFCSVGVWLKEGESGGVTVSSDKFPISVSNTQTLTTQLTFVSVSLWRLPVTSILFPFCCAAEPNLYLNPASVHASPLSWRLHPSIERSSSEEKWGAAIMSWLCWICWLNIICSQCHILQGCSAADVFSDTQ